MYLGGGMWAFLKAGQIQSHLTVLDSRTLKCVPSSAARSPFPNLSTSKTIAPPSSRRFQKQCFNIIVSPCSASCSFKDFASRGSKELLSFEIYSALAKRWHLSLLLCVLFKPALVSVRLDAVFAYLLSVFVPQESRGQLISPKNVAWHNPFFLCVAFTHGCRRERYVHPVSKALRWSKITRRHWPIF